MISSTTILGLGVIAAIGMLAWGLSGAITGRILIKSYGTTDGKRIYSRFVRRDEEPFWSWTVCTIYIAVGIGLAAAVCFLLYLPAA